VSTTLPLFPGGGNPARGRRTGSVVGLVRRRDTPNDRTRCERPKWVVSLKSLSSATSDGNPPVPRLECAGRGPARTGVSVNDYPLLNVFWTMMWLFLWVLWFFLLFKVITDIFRSHDLNGWAKAGWVVLTIVLPYLGVLIYLVVRGHSMSRRDIEQAKENEAAFKAYVREAAGPGETGPTTSHVDQLAKLADLKNNGAISDDEFQRAKQKLLT
jgi:hypothetical protein